jgi:LysM repeat protein
MPELQDAYELKPGDTLSAVANRFGISLSDLLKANQQISNPNLIVVGQKINIPSSQPEPANTAAEGHNQVYDGIHPAPQTISTNRANYVEAPLTNGPDQRTAGTYSQVIDQFAVGNNPRYKPGNGNTYCNIFVWDVSRAMGAEVAHWIDNQGNIAQPFAHGAHEININGGVDWMKNHGVPQHGWQSATPEAAQLAANQGNIAQPFAHGAHEININGGVDWMKNHGVPQHGWQSATPEAAQLAANQGRLAVVMWKNMTGGHGHTAIVRPGELTNKGPAIAQAGAHNFNLGHVVNGFGTHTSILYFVHN